MIERHKEFCSRKCLHFALKCLSIGLLFDTGYRIRFSFPNGYFRLSSGIDCNIESKGSLSDVGMRVARAVHSTRHGDRIVTHSISGDLAGCQRDKTEARSTMTGPAVSDVAVAVRWRSGGRGARAENTLTLIKLIICSSHCR